jgi:hypothetical protein
LAGITQPSRILHNIESATWLLSLAIGIAAIWLARKPAPHNEG